MAINKVVYGNNTLIDLTEDTVSADKLLAGETAHDRSGASIEGTVVAAEVVDNLTTQDSTKALSANQGYVLNQNKVDKVTGKGLSTNDYTDEEKTKLAGISAGAEPNVQSDWKQSDSSSDAFIKNKPTSDIKTSDDGQFTTVTGGLIQKCLIDLEPIQDLHGYSKPWTGGSGKNKCNPDTFVQGLLNSSTGVVDSNGSWITSDYISISDTITLSGYKDGTEANFCVRFCEYDANKTFIKNTQNPNVTGNTTWSRTITLDSNTRYVRTSVGFDNKATTVSAYFATNRLQIEEGSQATTYEPYSNICPISGHTQVQVGNVGKNILDYTYPTTTSNGITCTNNGDGTYTLNGTATADAIFILKDKESLSAIYEPYKSSEMKLLGCPSGGSDSKYRLQISRNNGSLIDTGNGVTIPSNAFASSTFWNLLIVVYSGQVLNNLVFKPMLTKDLSATYATFEPYNGYTVTINLGGEYYGGTLDAVSGVLTVTHKLVDMGDLTYNYNATENIFGTAIISDMAEPVATKVQLMCSVLNALTPKDITGIANADDNSIAFNSSSSKFMRIKCTSYTDGNALKSAMTGQKIAYEIATPTTIQLTPTQLETLVGQNDVFAPLVGQTVAEVEYREVLAFEDVPKAIPYENVAPDVGTGEMSTYFSIHRYGRVVVLTFLQDSVITIVEQATRKIFGVLPERFYTKVSGAMPYDTIKYTFINQNRFGVFVPKLLEIDPSNGNVYADYEADEGICPMGSLTYILDHD